MSALRRVTATLQGAPGQVQAALEVTAALEASLQGRPGQLAAIIGDPAKLRTLQLVLRDIMTLEITLQD
jgi:hypothetical protein